MSGFNNYFIIIIILAVALAGGAVFLISRRYKQARTEALRQAAQILNLNFFETGDSPIKTKFGHFNLFNQGRSRQTRNIAIGEYRDLPIMVFDHRYTTGGGDSSRVWNQTVLTIEQDRLKLVAFQLRPQQWLDRLQKALGKKRIEVENSEEFNRLYYLSGVDEGEVRNLFAHQVCAYLVAHRGWRIQGEEGKLMFYRANRRVRPEDLANFIQEGFDLAANFKAPGQGKRF
jgi:hypothetical protein